jgi:S1-C subfamily serine protease
MINHLPVSQGVVVAYVQPGSPAAEAGLQELDVITRFNGKEVTTSEELINTIHESQIGEEVTITFVRDNETKTIAARLIQSPSPSG